MSLKKLLGWLADVLVGVVMYNACGRGAQYNSGRTPLRIDSMALLTLQSLRPLLIFKRCN